MIRCVVATVILVAYLACITPSAWAACSWVTVTTFINGQVRITQVYQCTDSPAPASDSSAAAPSVDLGTDLRDAFCGGTNYAESCEPEEPEATEPVLTLGMITRAFQRVPLPADQILVQPPGGRTLVNFETNFYTQSQPLTRVVTLLGQRITLRATPATWTWTFGDGTTTTTTTPGAAYHNLDITHTYQREGRVAASVATTYTATYSVGGAPARPVPGTVTIDGPPAALQIDPARPQLVDYR